MQTLAQIKQLLAERGLEPKKSLGQNFLTDHNLINKLIESANLAPNSLILEVGPGTGTLTETLLERGHTVIACELDDNLAALNRDRLTPRFPDTFTLVHEDCLHSKRELSRTLAALLQDRPFKLVANLPYSAGTPLMIALLAGYPNCESLCVTIQKEVAERLAAGPATPKAYGSISVLAQGLCSIKAVGSLRPECFWPRPDVTSAMIALHRLDDPPAGTDPAFWPHLADLGQALFQTRRKALSQTLKRLAFPKDQLPDGIAPTARPEQLSIHQIISLARAIHVYKSAHEQQRPHDHNAATT